MRLGNTITQANSLQLSVLLKVPQLMGPWYVTSMIKYSILIFFAHFPQKKFMFFPSEDEDSVTGGNSTAPADSEIAVDSDNVLAMEHDVSLSPPATLSNNRPIKRTVAMLNVLQNDLRLSQPQNQP
jgi:hypothetical protein